MSDPVTNAEVEDVLSSIRRLVSQDRRPSTQTRTEKPAEGKLVLTPSLRVSNDAPLVDAYKAPKTTPEPVEWTDAAAPEAGLPGSDHLDDIEAVGEAMTNGADASADRFGTDEDFDTDSFETESLEHASEAETELRDTNAGADTPFAEDDFDLTADEDDVEEPALSVVSAKSVEEPPASEPAARHGILSLGASELVEDTVPSSPATSERLSAKIAALESAIRRIPENYEPDAPGDGDYSGSDAPAMAWEDDVELDGTGVPLHTRANEPSDAAIETALAEANAAYDTDEDAFDEDDSDDDEDAKAIGLGGEEYLDEEMLRDLVADIVRSELQGALGERITRNVRKLVRREIHRALTAQDLE